MDAGFDERAVAFPCNGEVLIGVIAQPRRPADTGVLIVVGGPQYRAGSHRQFVHLARHLASSGISSLRFDYRGMGDSTGAPRTFEDIAADLRSAIDELTRSIPHMNRVVIWGLCDAASAALLYAHHDRRVEGLALVNPWVRTEAGIAQAYLRHYYVRRLAERSFWHKLASGDLRILDSLRGLAKNLRAASRDRESARTPEPKPDRSSSNQASSLPARMEAGLRRFQGKVLLILSGNDLTAKEFVEALTSSYWQSQLSNKRIERRDLPAANHTFSSAAWKEQVAAWTVTWIQSFESTASR